MFLFQNLFLQLYSMFCATVYILLVLSHAFLGMFALLHFGSLKSKSAEVRTQTCITKYNTYSDIVISNSTDQFMFFVI